LPIYATVHLKLKCEHTALCNWTSWGFKLELCYGGEKRVLEAETSIRKQHEELERECGQQDWRLSFRARPKCVGILGECLLITSRSDMIGIKLTGDGLRWVNRWLFHYSGGQL